MVHFYGSVDRLWYPSPSHLIMIIIIPHSTPVFGRARCAGGVERLVWVGSRVFYSTCLVRKPGNDGVAWHAWHSLQVGSMAGA
jgi:predicted aconitase